MVKVEFDTLEQAQKWFDKLKLGFLPFLDEKQYLVKVELTFAKRD